MTDREFREAAELALELETSAECIELVDECLRDMWALKFRTTQVLDRFMDNTTSGIDREDARSALSTLRDLFIVSGADALTAFKDELIASLKGDGEAN